MSPNKAKTIISPKYNNKINTESTLSQVKSAENLEKKAELKKSIDIYFVLNRIIKSKLKNSLKNLGENNQ